MADGTFWGVFLGGALALGSSVVTQHYAAYLKNWTAENAAASIFKGGIGSLTNITRTRRYADYIRDLIAEIEQTKKAKVFRVQAKRQYIVIFESNLEGMGLLDLPLPEKICTFYTYVNSIVEDFDILFSSVDGEFDVEQLLHAYRELLTLMETTLDLGDVIVATIDARYPKLWNPWPFPRKATLNSKRPQNGIFK